MSFFGGMVTGYGEAQGQHNQKMLDFINQKSQTMAQLYGHLADNAQDQDTAAEFMKRATGWASANPVLDPKGYQQLLKGEKTGLHDIVDQAHQNKISQYHQDQFGVPTTGGTDGKPPVPAQAQEPGTAQVGGTTAPAPGVSGSPMPGASGPAPTPQPQPQPLGGGPNPPMMGTLGGAGTPTMAPPPPPAQSPVGAMPQPSPAAAVPPGGGPPGVPQGMPPAPGSPGSAPATPPQTMDQYVRSLMPPEPPQFGAMGRFTPEWQGWHDAYMKRLEGTVPTPPFMRQAMGPYMSSGFASPYIGLMRGELMAGARGLSSGYKLDPATHQWVPLRPEEQSMLQQVKIAKDQAQTLVDQATIPLRQSMTGVNIMKAKYMPIQMMAILKRIGIAQQNADSMSARTSAMVYGTDPKTGQPLPGAVAIQDENGQMVPVGTLFDRGVLPTAASQNRAESGANVMNQTNVLRDFATDPKNADLWGKYNGNLANFIAGHVGTDDPREALLRQDLISLASLMVPLHGFRSQKAAEEFLARFAQGNSAEAFTSAVMGANAVAKRLYDTGMPQLFTGSGSVQPRVANPNDQSAPGAPSLGKPGSNKILPATTAQKVEALKASGWDGNPAHLTPILKDKATKYLQSKGLKP